MNEKVLKIFAIDNKTGARFEITDLYWFEETGIHDFGGEGFHGHYQFEVFVADRMVFSSRNLYAGGEIVKAIKLGKLQWGHVCFEPSAPNIVLLKQGEVCPYCKRYRAPKRKPTERKRKK